MKSATETTLVVNLRRAIREQGRSVRGLAIDAGLLPDATRNILRGLSKNPSPESLAAIAKVLGITVEVLMGDEPWPAKRVPPALAKPPRRRAAARTASLSIPEYELQPGGPAGIADAGRVAVGTWSMPSDAIGAYGLGGDLEQNPIILAHTLRR